MNKTERLLFFLSLIWALLILSLGSWWLYLIVKFKGKLEAAYEYAPRLNDEINIIRLVKWEGGTFVILLILLSVSILLLYIKDRKRSKSIQSFFAAMTHELKTPLASVRLQSEVINDIANNKNEERLKDLSSRLITDSLKLENQMDKILQLARVERGGNLNIQTIVVQDFVMSTRNKWAPQLNINIESKELESYIYADSFALELIFRNLFENTLNHAQNKEVVISFLSESNDDYVEMNYTDHGKFSGNPQKIGKLFYKHNSKRGSGIGLYLISKLCEQMNTRFNIQMYPHLVFSLKMPKSKELSS